MRVTCPNCQIEGDVTGGSLDVLPTSLICGNCKTEFPYRATALERVAAEAQADPGAPFYLKPRLSLAQRRKARGGPAKGPEEAHEKQRLAKLKKVSTQRLLSIFQRARFPGALEREGEGYLEGFRYTELELKAELDTREHVARKR
jgi:hypothetical protein